MRFIPAVTACVIALCVGGCQTLSAVTNAVSGSSSEGDTRTAPSPSSPTAAAAPTLGSARAANAVGSLQGMTADALRMAWGEPTLKRTEAGAELWQYGGPSCAVLVYLYSGASTGMTVSHAEAVPGGADDASISACAKAAGKPTLIPAS